MKTRNKICTIPTMPDEIIDAIDNNNLIIFIGAGVSKLYGFPLWKEMAEKLINKAEEQHLISCSHKDILLNDNFTPMQIITIINSLFEKEKKASGLAQIVEILSKEITEERFLKNANDIYKYISAYNSLILTTNADITIDSSPYLEGRTVLNDLKDYKQEEHNNLSIIHIHGSVAQPETMIFTAQKYASSYMPESGFGKKLLKLFKNDRTILFVGYGVTEFELLRYFLPENENKTRKLFMLQGYLDRETIKLEMDYSYYKSLGITLLPFSREKNDYYQLINVFKKWDKEVKEKTLANSITIDHIVSDLFSYPPNPNNVQKICCLFNKHKINNIYEKIIKSQYLDMWILSLMKQTNIFSPKENIRPLIKIDNYYKKDFWLGLKILIYYSVSFQDNTLLNDKILSVINESIDVLQQDTNTNEYERLIDNFSTVDYLLELVLSKPYFINNTDLSMLIEWAFKSVTTHHYSIIYTFNKNINNLALANKEIVFMISTKILEKLPGDMNEHEKLMLSHLFKNNPLEFYTYFKNKISSMKKPYNMGSFWEFSEDNHFSKDILFFKYFKEVSTLINAIDLETDIINFIKSENSLLKKVGIALIGINFNRFKEVFFANLVRFLKDSEFYSDFRVLLNKIDLLSLTTDERTMLLDEINKATFGLDEETKIHVLKNHLLGCFKRNGVLDVVYIEETEEERIFAINFNKSIYIVNHDIQKDVAILYDVISAYDIYETIKFYNQKSIESSAYYIDILNKAVLKHILILKPDSYLDYLSLFNYKFSQYLIWHLQPSNSENKETLYNLLYQITKNICLDPNLSPCLNDVIKSLIRLNECGADKYEDLVKLINYKILKLQNTDISEESDVLSVCINEALYSYLDAITRITIRNAGWHDYFLEIIRHFVSNHNSDILKCLLAAFFPAIYHIDNKFALSLKTYIFDELPKNKRYCPYLCLPLFSSVSADIIDILMVGDRLKEFILFQFSNVSYKRFQIKITSEIFVWFLSHGKFKNLIDLVLFKGDYDMILDQLRLVVDLLENNNDDDSAPRNRVYKYLEQMSALIIEGKISFSDPDQIIRKIAKIITVSNDKIDCLWKTIVVLMKDFQEYFSDELLETIRNFQNTRFVYVVEIVNIMVSKYESYSMIENNLVNLINYLCDYSKHYKDLRRWRTALINKNHELSNVLKK